ncbi:hypothetical protein ID866_5242 [Astraeus odoratus]|nr:hypothetical protein ID866_5242 [Astraeus odoratus]
MRSLVTFTAALLWGTSAYAVVSVPLTRLQLSGEYLKGSPYADRARVAHLKNRAAGGAVTVPATSLGYVQYTTSVGIGDPPTYYNLVIDTGSSNTFCGAGTKYVRTNTSIPTGQNVNVTYGRGYFAGVEYLDQVTLAPNLIIKNQSIGDALSYAYFAGVDGIIGVGPTALTQGTLYPSVDMEIPTVMDNAVAQHLIECNILGVYFAPTDSTNDTNGAITYGGVDSSLYVSSVMYTPLTTTYPASNFWGINVTYATYGSTFVIPQSTAGIVDTGTTLVLFADDLFATYMAAIPGAQLDNTTGLLEIPWSSVPEMEPLTLIIDTHYLVMDVAAQLIPSEQTTAWGGDPSKRYSIINKLGYNSGQGLDFLLGQKFMERYYAVFDGRNNRVGFAYT